MKMMQTVYISQLKYYSRNKILEILSKKDLDNLIKHGIVDFKQNAFQFKYVGVIITSKSIINCYPKYIKDTSNIKNDFKEIIRVIKKYNTTKYTFEYENDILEDISFNLISLMLFFIENYYENGIYSNFEEILITNGNGEINWDRTINNTIPITDNKDVFYTQLQTKYKINDIHNYFKLLHEYIITDSSKTLENLGLLELFDITPIHLSDKTLDDFGDIETISHKITQELNIEFNTQKQKLLQSMYSYLNEKNSFTNTNSLKLYGSRVYHEIWEEMCRKVLDDKLNFSLYDLNLKIKSNKKLIDLIKKPMWVLNDGFSRNARKTFRPDLITIKNNEFIIMDAKYYDLKFNKDELNGEPGLESITKQYLYELAYRELIEFEGFSCVKNCFLFPKQNGDIENKGYVKLEILNNLDLENIQVILLPAGKINNYYLNNKKLDISLLNL